MQNVSNLSLKATAWFFVDNADQEGEVEPVGIKTPFTIGRNPESDLCLECGSVSGSHAVIEEVDGELWLYDLNSTNGTFLNGERISERIRLNQNDSVQFGTAVFQVNSGADKAAKPSASSGDTHGERFERLFENGVVPFFQPIVSLNGENEEIAGYELLGRSRLFGLRTPAQMFAAASRFEMEAELSRVLRLKGVQIADECLPRNQSLFVNTHAAEIQCEGLEESLFEIRDNHPNRPITLEVHESVLNKPERFSKLRATLENIDIQLALHDFGSGQVSLASLSEVVPDIVKFDINLIRGIDRASAKRQRFVSALVDMMKGLGIVPMAECVEQVKESETLKQLGFELGQGFYYGRPCAITDCKHPLRSKLRVPEEVPQSDKVIEETVGEVVEQPKKESPKDSDWLMSQPGHFYTIQVLSAISEERAKSHIAMQDNQEDFAIFTKQGKTRILHIVVCGIFEDRAAAKIETANFKNATISPWIRMLSSVQAEISKS